MEGTGGKEEGGRTSFVLGHSWTVRLLCRMRLLEPAFGRSLG